MGSRRPRRPWTARRPEGAEHVARQRPLSFATSGELAFTQFPYGRKLLYGRGVLRRRASISLGCVVAASAGGCGGHQSTTSFDNLKPPAAKPRLAAPGASVQIAAP